MAEPGPDQSVALAENPHRIRVVLGGFIVAGVGIGMVEVGRTRVEAAAAVGVNRRFVGEWVEAAQRLGDAALEGGRRGRRPGEQKPLSPPQERRIRRLIAKGRRLAPANA